MRKALLESQSGGQAQPVDPNLLLATGITRFGVLAIAIYLVQILIGLYRYNTRVAAYYLATSDALVVLDHKQDTIGDLHGLLWPDLDYGKTPQSIPQRIADAFSKSVDAAVSRWKKEGQKDTTAEDAKAEQNKSEQSP